VCPNPVESDLIVGDLPLIFVAPPPGIHRGVRCSA
jgi:hypothetical protein